MECSPSSIPAGSSSEASLIVILRNLNALPPVRGYQTQVSIVRTSGTGTVSVSCPGGVEIDDARSDYLYFNSANDFPATNCPLKRAASTLLSGGVTVGPTPAYLASYTLTTSPDATAGSTFDDLLGRSAGIVVGECVRPGDRVRPRSGLHADDRKLHHRRRLRRRESVHGGHVRPVAGLPAHARERRGDLPARRGSVRPGGNLHGSERGLSGGRAAAERDLVHGRQRVHGGGHLPRRVLRPGHADRLQRHEPLHG